jgi:hypothetical protein
MNQRHPERMRGFAGWVVVMNIVTMSVSYAQVVVEEVGREPFPGARAAAMGDACSADIPDAGMMFWNPGALPMIERKSVILDHYIESHTTIMDDALVTPIWVTPTDAIALSGNVSHIGYLTSDRITGIRAAQFEAGAAYSRVVVPGVGIGVKSTSRYISVNEEKTWTNSWTVGLAYNPSPEIGYGLVYSDLLYGARIQDSAISVEQQLPRRLEMGITMRYPSNRKEHIFTLSLGNEKLFTEPGLIYKGGVEYCPAPFLALRWGYLAGPDIAEPRYGIGIKSPILNLDYAIAPSKNDVQFQRFTIAITLR